MRSSTYSDHLALISNTKRATVHDKFFVVDGLTVETGSYNYTTQAARSNAENALVVYGHPDIARAYLENWQSVYEHGEDYRPGY